tara:strand:+ start:145 stop:2877 length:2733 start_codon:yes stop_codon:yes gene_type:complete
MLFGQTESQIKIAKQQIKKAGMSESQVREVAKSKGISSNQIDKLIQKEKQKIVKPSKVDLDPKIEVSELGKNLLDINGQLGSMEEGIRLNNNDIKNEQFLDKKNEDEMNFHQLSSTSSLKTKSPKLKHFGYDLFSRDPELFQPSEIGYFDPSYLIGPGDEIIIMLWGETQFRQVFTVDREGFLFVPEVGQIFVNGLNLNLLEAKMLKVFSRVYSSLDPTGSKPTSFLDISLGKLRPLRIQVLGEVSQPGAYIVNPGATLFTSLYYFKGPSKLGSMRDIRLIRGNTEIAKVDFYEYLLTGKRPNDEKLQLDDIVFVKSKLKTISINGEINRPRIYELKNEETLADLIKIASGLKPSAYLKRAQIDRIVPYELRDSLQMERMLLDVNLTDVLENGKTFELYDGDNVNIFPVHEDRLNTVEIIGAISRPGVYDLGNGLRLVELVNRADSLMGDAFLERADIRRVKEDLSEELIKVSLANAIENDTLHNIALQELDIVKIYSKLEMEPISHVNVKGHVKFPGKYRLYNNLTQENMKISDLLFMAGGFEDSLFKAKTYLERADLIRYEEGNVSKYIISINLGEILESNKSDQNIYLRPNDELVIYALSTFNPIKPIYVDGDVKNPGKYEYKKDMKIIDIILEAGGVTNEVESFFVQVSSLDSIKSNKYFNVNTKNIGNNGVFKEVNSFGDNFINSSDYLSKLNFSLAPYDKVSVRRNPYFQPQLYVQISGEVLFPGYYSILKEDYSLHDLIKDAGGLKTEAFPDGSKILRNGKEINIPLKKVIKNRRSKYNLRIKENDKIIISKKPETIDIVGQVAVEGTYKYIKGYRVNDYIKSAGGLNIDADQKSVWLISRDGKSKRWRKFLSNPKVPDGSTIHVKKKEEKEDFDITEFTKEVASILGDLAQVLVLFTLAGRQ